MFYNIQNKYLSFIKRVSYKYLAQSRSEQTIVPTSQLKLLDSVNQAKLELGGCLNRMLHIHAQTCTPYNYKM